MIIYSSFMIFYLLFQFDLLPNRAQPRSKTTTVTKGLLEVLLNETSVVITSNFLTYQTV